MEKPKPAVFSYNFFFPIPLALSILIFRRLLEKYCFQPIGVSLGIKPFKTIYYNERKLEVLSTLKTTNLLSPIQVTNINKYLTTFESKSETNQKIARFSRSCWHFTYYLVEFTHGLVILWNKPWLWDIKECWTDYPHQQMTTEVWVYCVINLAYYWSLLIKLFMHERRKDFTESLVHHTVAIFLIYISLIMSTFRIGTLVLVILLVSDIFLELSKMLKYLDHEVLCSICFGFFAFVWTVTRILLFPFWILQHVIVEAPRQVLITPGTYILNILLCLIAVLNVFWTRQIYKALWKAIKGYNLTDDRSDSEEDEYEADNVKRQEKKNF